MSADQALVILMPCVLTPLVHLLALVMLGSQEMGFSVKVKPLCHFVSSLILCIKLFNTVPFEDTYFLIASQTTVTRVSLDGQRYQILVNNLVNAVAIDYDYR